MTPNLKKLADKLVMLSDGSFGLRGTIQTEVREPSDSQPSPLTSQPTLDFISSDETIDRYDEIVSASGWRLTNYLRNPVFQNAHQYGDILFTLGRALITEVRSVSGRFALFQRIQFATEANPVAKIAYGLYKGQFLKAVSVGFVPIRWEDGTAKTDYRRKFLEQELLEVSAVSIPANPNALALGYKSGALEKSDVRELSQLLRWLTSESKNAARNELAHNLRLANSLSELLQSI